MKLHAIPRRLLRRRLLVAAVLASLTALWGCAAKPGPAHAANAGRQQADAGQDAGTDTMGAGDSGFVDAGDAAASGMDAAGQGDTGSGRDASAGDVNPGDAGNRDVATADSGTDAGQQDASNADGGQSGQIVHETEPNNGKTTTQVNDITAGGPTIAGNIGVSDVDIFKLSATPGKVYSATLTALPGSPLHPNLTVIDAGRSGQAAGNDYVKIATATTGAVTVDFLAMGQGGYYLAVRDARQVGNPGSQVGGPSYTYHLSVRQSDPTAFRKQALTLPAQVNATLTNAATVQLYSFQGQTGQNLKADMKATGDMDGRLFVYSESTGDWIARNDDRSASSKDPLIDAPLTASGKMWLVVENLKPTASNLGYNLSVSLSN